MRVLLASSLILYFPPVLSFAVEGNKCQRRGILDRYSLTSFSSEQVGMQPVPSLDEVLQVLSLSMDEYLEIVTEHLFFTGKDINVTVSLCYYYYYSWQCSG